MDFAGAIRDIGILAAAAATFTKPTVDYLRKALPEDRAPSLVQIVALIVGVLWAFLLVLIVGVPFTAQVAAQTVAGGVLAGMGAMALTLAHKSSREGEGS